LVTEGKWGKMGEIRDIFSTQKPLLLHMQKFKHILDNIKRIQTDNGLGIEKCFRNYVEKKDIVYYYNYPVLQLSR
jgi:hypothetical protein